MNYGIIALYTVQLIIAFLTGIAWWSLRSESASVKSAENRITAEVTSLKLAVDTCRTEVTSVRAEVATVKGSHYDTLLRRIDTAEATALGFTKQVDACLEKVASLGGRLSAMVRHSKPEKETAQPVPDGSAHPQAVRLFDEPQASPGNHIPGNFGRKVGRG